MVQVCIAKFKGLKELRGRQRHTVFHSVIFWEVLQVTRLHSLEILYLGEAAVSSSHSHPGTSLSPLRVGYS